MFNEKSLVNIRRPTKLWLRLNSETKLLEQKLFLPFLLDNQKNSIDLFGAGIDCNDCRNYWLTKQNSTKKVNDFKCLDEKQFEDLDHFKNCDI